jgi:hypothetical protein
MKSYTKLHLILQSKCWFILLTKYVTWSSQNPQGWNGTSRKTSSSFFHKECFDKFKRVHYKCVEMFESLGFN